MGDAVQLRDEAGTVGVRPPRWHAPAAFDEFVRERHAELLRFAHVLSGDPHLAADLVQDALVGTGVAWPRLRQPEDPEGYVRRAIVNRYLSRGRSLRRERLTDAVPERSCEDAEPPDGQLWRLLAGLPRQQRAVLVLRFYEDRTEAQVAEILGCGLGTVKRTGFRGLTRLREALAAEADPAGGAQRSGDRGEHR